MANEASDVNSYVTKNGSQAMLIAKQALAKDDEVRMNNWDRPAQAVATHVILRGCP